MSSNGFELYDLISFKEYCEGSGDNSERKQRLLKYLPMAIEELTPMQRKCIEMNFFDGMTQKEIAVTLGINKATVSRTIKRAKARIANRLKYSL